MACQCVAYIGFPAIVAKIIELGVMSATYSKPQACFGRMYTDRVVTE